MTAYLLRRLLLVIPTLIGIMVINFALTQFVPGGPVEQVLARLEGEGDAFSAITGGGNDAAMGQDQGMADERYIGSRGLPPEFIDDLERQFGFARII
ncbi:MAG TPA: microcin ABC transporter permease, partial [Rhodobacter sp.]|nr:microcin ABC transporter permease [Rhodobacter sp.]